MAALRLLSNPAGELVPLYQRLSSRQASLAGYSLAVLANLAFVLGTMTHFPERSWLLASYLWAAGGLMYVAMVLAVAIARVGWRIRSLWVAHVYVLGVAMVPLGLLAVVSAILPVAIAQSVRLQNAWVTSGLTAIAVLWALSQALLTLYIGLVRIHTFPERVSTWFAPVVLALGMAAGIGTWVILAVR